MMDAKVKRWVAPIIAAAIVIFGLQYLGNIIPAIFTFGGVTLGKILTAAILLLVANEINARL